LIEYLLGLEHIQTIGLGGKYPIAVALSSLPGSTGALIWHPLETEI
jgi:hypothetical protein